MSKIETFDLYISQLNDNRTVRVYLPDDYSDKGDGLPVIYMHDGWFCFAEDKKNFDGGWRADKAIADIRARTGHGAIVVAIDASTVERCTEYSPWVCDISPQLLPSASDLGGKGALYAEFVAHELKNIVDERYNTSRDRNATAVCGASMGGLISLYTGLQYQAVFGTMGIFSPSMYFNYAEVTSFLRTCKQRKPQHATVYMGGREEEEGKPREMHVDAAVKLYRKLSARGIAARLILDDVMAHDDRAWSTYFPVFAEEFILRNVRSKDE